jgi:hypothetical protein
MLISFQQPIADLRPFLSEETGRLARPRWLNPAVDVEFVRGAGALRTRRRGGVSPWPGEGSYCDASRLVRSEQFPALAATVGLGRHRAARSFEVAFRRLLSNGEAVVRFELGLGNAPSTPMSARTLNRVLWAVATLPVRVPHRNPQYAANELALTETGTALAHAYLAATTSVALLNRSEGSWVSHGSPVFLVEFDDWEVVKHPRWMTARWHEVSPGVYLATSIYSIDFRRSGVRVWYLTSSPNNWRERRSVRVHLMRIHAEREALGATASALAEGRLCTEQGEPPFARLEGYLENSAGFLLREKAYGHDQPTLLRRAYQVAGMLTPGQRESLLEQLRQARASTRWAISEVQKEDESRWWRII